MYKATLFFKIKDTPPLEKYSIVEVFFKYWVDCACNNEVNYTLQEIFAPTDSSTWEEIYKVEFDYAEDAIALKLMGVPKEFEQYIEIINYS